MSPQALRLPRKKWRNKVDFFGKSVGKITGLPIKQAPSTRDNLNWVAQWIDSNREKNRTDWAKEVCQEMNWRDHKGHYRVSTTLKALTDLEGQGHFKLPEPVISGPRQWKAKRLNASVPAAQAVTASGLG